MSEGKPTGATCGDEGSIVRGGWVLVVVEVDGGRWSVAGLPGCFLEDRYPLIGPAHGRCESSRNCEETGQFACAFPQSVSPLATPTSTPSFVASATTLPPHAVLKDAGWPVSLPYSDIGASAATFPPPLG